MSARGGCDGALGPGDVRIATLGLGPRQATALDVMRFFFTAHAQPESQAWMAAFELAAAAEGPELGPAVGWRALRVVQALRGSRRSAFRFSNPVCPGCRGVATETERRLMTMVLRLGRGELAAARADALLLCEGGPTAPLLREGERLARLLGEAPAAPGEARARAGQSAT